MSFVAGFTEVQFGPPVKPETVDAYGALVEASYELNMSYNKMHNIVSKNLVHTINSEQKGYVLNYNYDNTEHPNAPSTIIEANKPEPREYEYDGNGNPTSYSEHQSFRKMTWDEENRLMGINDNGRIHQYTYDANGERVLRSSGGMQSVSINGETAATISHTDDYTGYVSPYFVISKGKFTKHYFEGAGRIVSKIGNGSFAQPLGITAGGVNYTALTSEQQKALDNYVRSLSVPPGPPTQQGIYASPEFTGTPYPADVTRPVEENEEPPEGWPRNPAFNEPGDVPGPPVQFGPPVKPETVAASEGFKGTGMPENDIFYYHPDHLGSTSYITNKNGAVSQHVEYIAFGEVLFEEHSSSFTSPYLFNGKELDRETNLSYFGARYLDMKTSLWLSVDPLAEQFYGYSSYNFSFNNPIRYTDPDGMEPEDWVQGKDGDIKWDKDANSQATTKPGETYLGKTLNFEFNSYIDANLWDGPLGSAPAGDKLTSNIKVTGNENEAGELISITATKIVEVGDTPIGSARAFYPGLGGNQNKFTYSQSKKSDGVLSTYSLNFEQHASVSKIEELGMNAMGYDIVNVGQKLNLKYAQNKLSLSVYTDIFPSATLKINGRQMMHYTQPSFKATHSPNIEGYRPTKWYKR